jgi:hypothetical protein
MREKLKGKKTYITIGIMLLLYLLKKQGLLDPATADNMMVVDGGLILAAFRDALTG